jgi:hypothetical protein
MDDPTRHGPYDPNLDAEMDAWMDEMCADQSAYWEEQDRILAAKAKAEAYAKWRRDLARRTMRSGIR